MVYDFSRMPKHLAFISMTIRFPAMFGGWGSAKTVALCVKILKHLIDYPGSTAILGRNTVRELEMSTMKTFFEMLGCTAINAYDHPSVEYWNATKRHLVLKNGSDIYFVYLNDEAALGVLKGPNISVIGIDQAEEINEEVFAFCDARARHGDCPNWVALVGNPAGHNWIWRRYFRKFADHYNHKLWVVKTEDNPHLKADYVRSLRENHDPEWVARYVDGSFDAYVGNVYKEWRPEIHLIPRFPIPDAWKKGYGADFGYRTYTSFVGVAGDYDGHLIIHDEVRGKEMLPVEFCSILKDPDAVQTNTHRIHSPFKGLDLPIYGDPNVQTVSLLTGTNTQEEYMRNGVYILPGNKMKRIVGIQRIKDWMKVDFTKPHPFKPGVMGECKLYCFDDIPGFAEEVENYQFKPQREIEIGRRSPEDEVLKVDDHSLDAFRYFAMSWGAFDVIKRSEEVKPGSLDWAVPQAVQYRKSATRDWRAA